MDKKLKTLQIILYFVAIGLVSGIIQEIQDFTIDRLLESEIYQKSAAGAYDSPLLSVSSLEYSAYFINAAKIAVKAYLIVGIIYLLGVFKNIKEESYFTETTVSFFKKAGTVFVNYCILIFSLEIVFLFVIQGGRQINELLNHYNIPIIAACGVAFIVLSHIFNKGKNIQEDNELTI